MARSLNRAQLIGNLTRDPELRYTPNGTAVCSFGLATNRSWKTETGEKREEADFHNIVAWNKLAEICSQFLVKGRKVYVEGRISTRSWTGQDGTQKIRTEIIISDMILLDSKRSEPGLASSEQSPASEPEPSEPQTTAKKRESKKIEKKESLPQKDPSVEVKDPEQKSADEVVPEDIPF